MTDDRLPLNELLQKAGDGDFLRAVAESVLQLLMEADVEGLIGAGRHERNADRLNWRNGYRDRTLDTRLGSLSLKIPKLRAGRSYEEGRQRAALCQTVAVRPSMETGMSIASQRSETPSAVRVDLGAIFISLELSQSKWLITSLSPGGGEKLSQFSTSSGNVAGLLGRFAELQRKAEARTTRHFSIIVIQEAGLDGFWIHRVLELEGIESHVVDPASIAVSRRKRRVKTDKIDGETLIRTLLAYKRGEPRVCAMVRAPTPEEEDHRRVTRERKSLMNEAIRHTNRIKGLLFGQGSRGYEPHRRDRRKRLDMLTTGDGRPLPTHLKAQISRELDRLELVLEQIKVCEQTRDSLIVAMQPIATNRAGDAVLAGQSAPAPSVPAMLLKLRGIGPETASVLWLEGLSRRFDNRRQVAAYAGLAPSHWQSGQVDHNQGVSKAGNPRLRTSLIQLAWLWVRHQPGSSLTIWFKDRVAHNGGRLKKTTIVALARKLLVALWKYVNAGVVIDGAIVESV
jgi:transposase